MSLPLGQITVYSISDPTNTTAPSAGPNGSLGRLALESSVYFSKNIVTIPSINNTNVNRNVIYSELEANTSGGFFVIGSPSISGDGNNSHDNRLIFDKEKGMLYAGSATGSEWDTTVVPTSASPKFSTVLGKNNICISDNSIVIGTEAKSTINSSLNQSGGMFYTNGDSQYTRTVLRQITTNDTEIELPINANTNKNLDMPDDTVWNVMIQITSVDISGSEFATFNIEGTCSKFGGTTTINNKNITTLYNSSGASSWDVDIDVVSSRFQVRVKGDNTHTIKWTGTIHITQTSI